MNQVLTPEAMAELTDLDGFNLDEVFALTHGYLVSLKGLPPSPGVVWVSESASSRVH